MKHPAIQLSIIAEKVFENAITDVLTEEGAKGYTVAEGGGSGSFHLHPSAFFPDRCLAHHEN